MGGVNDSSDPSPKPPILTVQPYYENIIAGAKDYFDFRVRLIWEATSYDRTRNLMDKVQVVDTGGFDKDKPGEYEITFELTDNGISVRGVGKVKVWEKPVPTPTPVPPHPEPHHPEPHHPVIPDEPTPDPDPIPGGADIPPREPEPPEPPEPSTKDLESGGDILEEIDDGNN